MARARTRSGEVSSVAPLGAALAQARTAALIKATQLEVVRLVLPAGQALREHRVPGEITVQCLEGEVEFDLPGATRRLVAGDWLHLAAREPHALRALGDASLLVTICLLPAP
jgi:quercetin dioxygenase-like cupin family protein